jgi:hypothetical protein
VRAYSTKYGVGYHPAQDCAGEVCAVHRPSKSNPMREWMFQVRLDKYGLMERYCEHGVGHTDPDSLDWAHRQYDERFERGNVDALGIHGCDGCCHVAE